MLKTQEAKTSTNLLRKFYDYIQVLSLDVVLGGIVTAHFFSLISKASFNSFYYLFLGSCTWLVYTADHLIDAYKIKGVAITYRHRYHQNHFKKLSLIWVIIFLISFVTAFQFLPTKIIYAGLFIAFLALSHLVLVVFLWTKISNLIQKEIGVGIGYALGVLLLPYMFSFKIDLYFCLCCLEFFLLVMLNIYIFTLFDEEKDSIQGQSSMARNVGRDGLTLLINFLFTTTSILIILTSMIFHNELKFQLIFILMFGSLFLIFFYKEYFGINDRYRILGDGIFIMPLLFLVYEWI